MFCLKQSIIYVDKVWEVLPAKYAKDKVEHEEGPDDNERHEVDPVKETPQGIISLKNKKMLETNNVCVFCLL